MIAHTAMPQTPAVVLIRHAQSTWNVENRFTGWADPPLTERGIAEAVSVGDRLRAQDFRFDLAYSSCLRRAVHTLDILLARLEQTEIARQQDWRLNERHYGALQGLDKMAVTAQVGEHQVWRWRRGYEDRAAPLARTHPDHPIHDAQYAGIDPQQLPSVESLADTRARVTVFWRECIVPHLHNGKRILISAHGNTLRALLMDLAAMSVTQVEAFEIPTAAPIVCRFDEQARPIGWEYLA